MAHVSCRDVAVQRQVIHQRRSGEQQIPRDLPSEIVSEFSGLEFRGTPNQLSEEHVDWEIISRVAEATANPVLGRAFAARAIGLPDTTRPFTPTAVESLPHKSFANEEARWPSWDRQHHQKPVCTMLDDATRQCAPSISD
jgi:hypothetical protein